MAKPLDLEKANNEQLAWFFFGGLVDRRLHDRGVPDWITAAPSKVMAVRANLESEHPKLFGYAGWLTSINELACTRCGTSIQPMAELYFGRDWQPHCPACEEKAAQEEKQWFAECESRKREAMLKRVAAAKERWRQQHQPDPRQCDLFEGKP